MRWAFGLFGGILMFQFAILGVMRWLTIWCNSVSGAQSA